MYADTETPCTLLVVPGSAHCVRNRQQTESLWSLTDCNLWSCSKNTIPGRLATSTSLLPPCILNLPQTPLLASPSDRLAPLA
ncbi:hypothetical protein JOB18_038838 [Solea senegalensis]|uniref:Uncharacterized protein n=1 Tax=Solea senegalensis TaxID=28829 RepID=A0AAV6QRZ2_SOLSE|nr:hypothetical protein JOB18_038838 [Solea senegalensis]